MKIEITQRNYVAKDKLKELIEKKLSRFEKYLEGAINTDKRCEQDGRVITAVGMGAAVEFGLKIVEALCGKEVSEKLKNGILA